MSANIKLETPSPEILTTLPPLKVGLVSVSDRASSGVYQDEGIPTLKEWLNHTILNPIQYVEKLIADEQQTISDTLFQLADAQACHLIFTTGGTGPAIRDVTPEATLAVADKIMPGFGEQMRQISLCFVPTAILSRQVAVICKQSLIVNLPGQPKSIAQTLGGLPASDTHAQVHGIFAAIPYCIDLIGGPYIEVDQKLCAAFRPPAARKIYQPDHTL